MGPLSIQGVQFGVCRSGPCAGCYVLLSAFGDKSGGEADGLLVELAGGDSVLEDQQVFLFSATERAKYFLDNEVEWMPDTDETLQVADEQFPRRLVDRRLITRLLRFVQRP